MKAAQVCRPRVILLEKVNNICRHRHFPDLLELFRHASFQLQWQRSDNTPSLLGATSRTRLLAVLVDMRVLSSFSDVCMPSFNHWILQQFQTRPSAALLAEMPDQHCANLGVPCEVLPMYQEPDFMPGYVRDVLGHRNSLVSGTMGTAMAAYTTQHDMSTLALSSRGMHASLVPEPLAPSKWRFLSPFEFALAHIFAAAFGAAYLLAQCHAVGWQFHHCATSIGRALRCGNCARGDRPAASRAGSCAGAEHETDRKQL